MAQVNNCNVVEELYYWVEKHVWVRPEGNDVCAIGMTDVSQNMAGKIVSITPKKVGRKLAQGKSVATIESSKWVGPVPSPVAGEIVEINQEIVGNPGLLNESPYGEGWILKLKVENLEEALSELVTGSAGVDAYQKFLDSEGIDCSKKD